MNREPHSHPWCNWKGVKRATVGMEQGRAEHTLGRQKHSAQPAFLLLNPRAGGGGVSQSMEHFHNSVYISGAAVIQQDKSVVFLFRETKQLFSKQGNIQAENPFCQKRPNKCFIITFYLGTFQGWFLYIELHSWSPPPASRSLHLSSLSLGSSWERCWTFHTATEDLPRHAQDWQSGTYTAVYLSLNGELQFNLHLHKSTFDTLTLPSNTWSVCSDHFQRQPEAWLSSTYQLIKPIQQLHKALVLVQSSHQT